MRFDILLMPLTACEEILRKHLVALLDVGTCGENSAKCLLEFDNIPEKMIGRRLGLINSCDA